MKLSRTVTYALRATLQLAQSDSSAPVPCSRLASQGDMPERFLLQILRSLVTHGILRSTRGVEGGYVLVRPSREISLLDVIEAIDGPMAPHEMFDGLPSESHVKLKTALQQVTNSTRDQLEAIKLSQLISPPQKAVGSRP
jgi:Rrf2 family protein